MTRSFRLAFFAAILAGCTRNVYDIELEPAGDTLERKLTVTQKSRDASDAPQAFNEEVKRIAGAYHAEVPPAGKVHVFRRRFAGRMPNDIGGDGSYTHFDTPLGSAGFYIERFRGTDDVAGILKRLQATADRLVDLLVAWLEQELKGEPQWPGLRRFLHEGLRHDLHNLAIYAWTANFGHKPEEYAETAVRALQYLVERGYVKPAEIPLVSRAFADADHGDYARVMTWCTDFVTARAGGKPLRALEKLSTPEAVGKSLTAFLETTDDYAGLLQKWQEQHPNAKKPHAIAVLSDLIAELFVEGLGFQLGGDQVSVALKSARPVFLTNGQRSAESERITWPARHLPTGGLALPSVIYAIWDEPDEIGQKSHFGAVVLEGQSLLEFCVWYRGLSDSERKEWDTLIDGLGPNSRHEESLQNFRFSHEPAGRSKDNRLAKPAVEAILTGLRAKR